MYKRQEIAPAVAAIARAAAPAIAKAVVKKASGSSNNEEKEDEVKPHMMYDPKTGKGVMAKDKADHIRLGKKGYVHDKPDVKEKFANAAQQAAAMAAIKAKPGYYKKPKKEAYNEPQGQAKSMMSPLQKARLDKEKADRDRQGKLKPAAVRNEATIPDGQTAMTQRPKLTKGCLLYTSPSPRD